MSEGGIFDSIGKIFSGPSNQPPAQNSAVPMSTSSTNSANSRPPNTRSVSTPNSTLSTFRNRNSKVLPTDEPLPQSGGKRKMRSKSKSLRSLLFLKYKYKMARRSTMRKGRKGSRKASRKGSRRARR